MGIKLRSVEDLAKELDRTQVSTQKFLFDQGIRVVDGFFNQQRLDAASLEPAFVTKRRQGWGLSHASGLGAIKFLLDPLKVDIVEHECRGAQWLMLRGPKLKRNRVKVYYKGKLNNYGKSAQFQIRNFLREGAPTHFLCVSFDGPHAWAISSRELTKKWDLLLEQDTFEKDDEGFHIPYGGDEHPGGFLGVTFKVDIGRHVLTTPAKIGV